MFAMKKATAFLGVSAMLLALPACGGGSTGGIKEVSFQTWNLKNDTYTPYFNDLIKAFENENQGVKVKWIDQPADGYTDKLNADAAAGTLPDVVDMSPNGAYSLAKAKVVVNLSKEDPEAEGRFTKAAWQAVSFSGRKIEKGAYAYPWYLNSGVQYYNTEVLHRCGVTDLPKDLNSWFSAARALGSACPGTSMVAAVPTLESLGEYGASLMDEGGTKFTFNDEKGVELVQHYVDMYKEKALSSDSLNNQWTGEGDAFKQGSVASLSGSAYSVSDFEKNAPKVYQNLEFVQRLIGPTGKPNVAMETLVVSKTATNPQLAMKLARFITNKANQTAFCIKSHTFPSAEDAIKNPSFTPTGDSKQDKAVALASKAILDDDWFASPAPFSGNAKDKLREQIAMAIQGKITARQALDKAVAVADEDLE